METKLCFKCNLVKPVTDFRLTHPATMRRRRECIKCEGVAIASYKRRVRGDKNSNWYWSSRASSINHTVLKRYGLQKEKLRGGELRMKFEHRNHCWLCGQSLVVAQGWFDHLIPCSRGGENSIDNLELFCKVCNELKNTLLLSELFDHIVLILRNHLQ